MRNGLVFKRVTRACAPFTPFPKAPMKTFLTLPLLAALSLCAWSGRSAAEEAPAATPAIAPVKLAAVSADSEETGEEDGKAANAVDGDANTFWHTKWGDDSPACPHEIVISLDHACKIDRFTYLPRQDGNENGNIKDYEFYVSTDGKDFGKPVSQGTFENNAERKTVKFDAVTCAFIKLKAVSEVNGEAWTSAAEIGVVQEGEKEPEASK